MRRRTGVCVCVWGVHLTTLESCWRLGCSRVSPLPGEPGRPRGMSGPSAFAAEVPGPRGPRGPVRRALRGSELLVRAAGSRLRSPGRIFRGRSWGEGGIPCPPPPSLPSPPPSLGGPTPLWLCLPRAPAGRNSAPPQAAPRGPGIPSVTHGTPLASPGSWGPAWVRTSGSSCIPPFRAAGPPPASPTWTGCSLRPPGRGSSRSYTGEGRIPRVGVFAPPPSWAPPGERSPGQRGAHFSLAACVSDAAALHLGDIPRLDDRQLLQGTTSRCRASRFGGGCLLWSRSWLGVCVCVLEWRGGG